MQVATAPLKAMLGTIRGRHLLTHGPLIVRLFGLRVYVRCVVRTLSPNRTVHVTFLGVLNETAAKTCASRAMQ
jgi:hypothetical protein